MFKSLSIKNFRSFRDLDIQSLDRVNLIAGKNNVGKTALLEALYLLAAPNPVVEASSINLLRGFEDLNIKEFSKWSWLFYNEQIGTAISLSACDEVQPKRTLIIHFPEIDAGKIRPDSNLRATTYPTTPSILDFTYRIDGQEDRTLHLGFGGQPRPLPPIDFPSYPVNVLPSTFRHSQQDVRSYSRLVTKGAHQSVISTLQLLDPRIQNLEVLDLAGIPMVYGKLDSGKHIPVAQMGEGFGRIFSILLHIAEAENGIVLIDEIENGLHYSVLADVWKAISEAARRSNVQVFATTHSWECITAAHEAFSQSEIYDLRLHRIDRIKGDITSVAYSQETLNTAIDLGMEVR